jgi:hypothetical protein
MSHHEQYASYLKGRFYNLKIGFLCPLLAIGGRWGTTGITKRFEREGDTLRANESGFSVVRRRFQVQFAI